MLICSCNDSNDTDIQLFKTGQLTYISHQCEKYFPHPPLHMLHAKV